MRAGSFSGGIRPPETKGRIENSPFSNLSVPHQCSIPIQHRAGTAARPVVAVGDVVREGQLIAADEGAGDIRVHASIPGRVMDIGDRPAHSGGCAPCIVIEAAGSFSGFGAAAPCDWTTLTPVEIVRRVREAGVMCAHGAGIPAARILAPPEGCAIDTIIVHGAECEPYLTAADMLLRAYPAEILEGARIALRALGASRAIIAIPKSLTTALAAIRTALAAHAGPGTVTVRPVSDKYPQGNERLIIKAAARKTIHAGTDLTRAGFAVLDAATVIALREAVLAEKPLIERPITVGGPGIRKPGNYKVRIGTAVEDVIRECEGLVDPAARVIMGGPISGTAVRDMRVPVTGTTTAIIALLGPDHGASGERECIRCGRCVAACPMGLMPHELDEAARQDRHDAREARGVEACIACHACSYVCPSRRPIGRRIDAARTNRQGAIDG